MKLKAICLVFLTLGCNSYKYSYDVPIEFQSYINQFEIDAKKHNKSYKRYLTIRFDDSMDVKQLGGCTISKHKNPYVRINPNYWNNASESDRLQLIYHELGHCWLNLKHNDIYFDSYPSSLMNTYHIDKSIFDKYYQYYINQLFSN